MTDNFGRWTSSEASKQLQDFCLPKKAEKMTVLNKQQQEDIKKIFPRNDPDCKEIDECFPGCDECHRCKHFCPYSGESDSEWGSHHGR
jgi:hypothetical protein